MTRCDVVHFEAIMQIPHDAVYFCVGRGDQMKATDDEVNVRIDRGCQFGEFVDTRMGTANDDDYPAKRHRNQRRG